MANSGGRASYNGPVTVRLMSDQEVLDRQGTYWDLGPDVDTSQYVYEISFMGEVHNTEIDAFTFSGKLERASR